MKYTHSAVGKGGGGTLGTHMKYLSHRSFSGRQLDLFICSSPKIFGVSQVSAREYSKIGEVKFILDEGGAGEFIGVLSINDHI